MADEYRVKDEEAGISNSAADSPPPYGSDAAPPAAAPSYDNPGAPPPSYDSLYGKLKGAKQESTSALDFAKKFIFIILGTIGCTIVVGLVLAVPIAMITIGSIYLHDCPLERYIPIYLIVGGVFGVLTNMSNMLRRCCKKEEDGEENKNKPNPLEGIVNCFLLAWFIAGNVWVYGSRSDYEGEDVDSSNYCHPTLYWFSFWLITSSYIIAGVACLCCVGTAICVGCASGLKGGS